MIPQIVDDSRLFFGIHVGDHAGLSASADPIPFTNYSGDFRMDPTGAVWGSYYHEGPWRWLPKENDPAGFWTPQTCVLWEAQYLPPEMRPDGTLALPYAATITIKATDNGRIDGDPVGTMVFQSPGVIIADLSPAAITVDPLDNLFLLPYWAEAPAGMTLVEETGIFETDGIELTADLLYETRGVIGLATVEGMTPAEVMMTYGFSPDRVVGAIGEGVIYGTYLVPEPSTLVLLGVSVGGLLAYAWRRRRAA